MEAIRDLANQESCVIVGRNSDYILAEFDHCLRVFVHAGFQWRVERMVGMMKDATQEQVRADAREADRARKRYCEYYTHRSYGDARNYDLTLNTEKLGSTVRWNWCWRRRRICKHCINPHDTQDIHVYQLYCFS